MEENTSRTTGAKKNPNRQVQPAPFSEHEAIHPCRGRLEKMGGYSTMPSDSSVSDYFEIL